VGPGCYPDTETDTMACADNLENMEGEEMNIETLIMWANKITGCRGFTIKWIKGQRNLRCKVGKKTFSAGNEKEFFDAFVKLVPVKPKVNVGDIVTKECGYGWFDGDKKWVVNPRQCDNRNPKHGNCFQCCCTMGFYYVVTAIDRDFDDISRLRYHLITNAMTGKDGHRQFYTYEGSITKVKRPKKYLITTSRKLLGQKVEYYN